MHLAVDWQRICKKRLCAFAYIVACRALYRLYNPEIGYSAFVGCVGGLVAACDCNYAKKYGR